MWKLKKCDVVVKEAVLHLGEFKKTEIVLEEALGRYSAEIVKSTVRLPLRPKSTMDGFAVNHVSCYEASPQSPVVLKLVEGVLRPGVVPSVRIDVGEAVRIETGGFLPDGADAVIPVENVEVEGDRVVVYKPVGKYENVSLPGEELESNLVILARGDRVRPWHLAALRACGIDRLLVYDTSCSIIATGSEFFSGFSHPPFTIDLVSGWFEEIGFNIVEKALLPDDPQAIKSKIEEALEKSSLVIVLGGTSLGKHDYSVKAVKELEPEYLAHGVALRPGKTTCIAVKNGKLVACISGLPAAAFSALECVVKPILARLGLKIPQRPRVTAKLTRRVTVKLGFRGFVRVKVYRSDKGELLCEPLMVGGSGSLNSLILGNGFLIIPEEVEGFDEGEEVEVELYSNTYI